MKKLVIQQQKEGKGRAFTATLVACVEAREILPRGNDAVRPIFLSLVGSDSELRPFVANLRTGKKAEHGYKGRERYEILKSAGYQCAWQRTSKGTLATLFAPDLFCLDPGMVDPKGVVFCLLPARSWLRPLDVPVPDCVPEERMADVLGLAPLFVAYLDRRTRCPLIPDPRFYVQILAHALDQGLARFSRTAASRYGQSWGESSYYEEAGTEDLGLAPGLFFHAGHDVLEQFLADEVKAFFGADVEEKVAA